MDIAIYYQKWDEKKKNSHTLLEQAVRRYARENALLLPETLILASTEQKKKPGFKCGKHSFSISHSGAWWSCAVSTEEVGLGYPAGTALPGGTSGQTFYHPLEVAWLEKKRIFAFLQTMGIQRKLCKIYRCRTDTGNRLFLCHKSVRYSDGSSGCLPAVGGFSTGLPYGGHNGT